MLGRLVRRLAVVRRHRPTPAWTFDEYRPEPGIRLFVSRGDAIPAADAGRPSHRFARHVLSLGDPDVPPDGWVLARSGHGELLVEGTGRHGISLSTAGDHVVAALFERPGTGVDAETHRRVATHTRPDDPWLSPAERGQLARVPAAALAAELTCRWVLKEALGKANGTGLDLPLAEITLCAGADRPLMEVGPGHAYRVRPKLLGLYAHHHLVIALAFPPPPPAQDGRAGGAPARVAEARPRV